MKQYKTHMPYVRRILKNNITFSTLCSNIMLFKIVVLFYVRKFERVQCFIGKFENKTTIRKGLTVFSGFYNTIVFRSMMPTTQGPQIMVAWGHRWKAPKRAGIVCWLKPPTYTDYTFVKITQLNTHFTRNRWTNGGSRQYTVDRQIKTSRK